MTAAAKIIPSDLAACRRCGQIQHIPSPIPPVPDRLLCARCHARLITRASTPSSLPAALALAALILYPLAMSMPVLELQKLGHARESTIWSGVVQLFSDGHLIIGAIILICSVVIPLAKILGIFILSSPTLRSRFSRRYQSLAHRAIDWLGRWGMIDVLLVAILVAAVKLGDWITVTPGPGIIAFAAVVILSLLSSFTFRYPLPEQGGSGESSVRQQVSDGALRATTTHA